MNEHFITEIEIKNFKCFKDFTAEGFKRVNLIGGKNNVGKTAFMEACYLDINKNEILAFLTIDYYRNSSDFVTLWNNNNFEEIVKKYYLICKNGSKEIYDEMDRYMKYFNNLYLYDKTPPIDNFAFISNTNLFNKLLVDCIDEIKLNGEEDIFNDVLKKLFEIEKIDVIKNSVMLKRDKKYLNLSEFGGGIKHFINIISALLLNKDSVIFIDEIENGIHYMNYKKLWEMIFTISKKNNIQVFITTHSEEMIEVFVEIAKKLEDENITYIRLSEQKDGTITSPIFDYELLEYGIEQEHEVRGW